MSVRTIGNVMDELAAVSEEWSRFINAFNVEREVIAARHRGLLDELKSVLESRGGKVNEFGYRNRVYRMEELERLGTQDPMYHGVLYIDDATPVPPAAPEDQSSLPEAVSP